MKYVTNLSLSNVIVYLFFSILSHFEFFILFRLSCCRCLIVSDILMSIWSFCKTHNVWGLQNPRAWWMAPIVNDSWRQLSYYDSARRFDIDPSWLILSLEWESLIRRAHLQPPNCSIFNPFRRLFRRQESPMNFIRVALSNLFKDSNCNFDFVKMYLKQNHICIVENVWFLPENMEGKLYSISSTYRNPSFRSPIELLRDNLTRSEN